MIRGLGEKLKEERMRLRLTQVQLARRLGVDASTISLYETGGTTPPSDVLVKLAAIFDVSLDYLMNLEKKRTLCVEGLENHQIDALKVMAQELRAYNELKNK